MVVLGFDPGLERLGYGVVRREGSRLEALDYGVLTTPRIEIGPRLAMLDEAVRALVERTSPDLAATERLLFSVNRKTAMDVAKALGVTLCALAHAGVPCQELGPSEVKLAVVGHGAAEKSQVEYMVVRLLGLSSPPKPDDAADALAIAIAAALRARAPLTRT